MPIETALPTIPNDDAALVNPETGVIEPEWYRLLLEIIAMLKEIQEEMP